MNKFTWCAVMILALSVATDAHAICPKPTPKVCAAYYESDAVFLGKVTAKEHTPSSDPDVGWIRYTIKVQSIYRGHPKAIEHVLTEDASDRWYADVGKTYLVFEDHGQTGATCGPLDEPSYAPQAIQQILELKNATHATIEGEVLRRDASDGLEHAANGVHVKVSRAGKVYEAVTDAKGQFSIALPPGHYRFVSDELRPTIYSNLNTSHIDLQNGQCAQFQMITK